MGLFSKIWKGIKKTFKKIGKGIKKVFQKVGKFMNKIGIVGQIAMSFILPGIGGVLAKTFGNVVGALSGGALGAVGKAAGWVLGKAGEFAKMAYKGYKTVTGAITDFIGTTGKYVGGKLGIGEEMSLSQAFGKEGWGGRLTDSFSELGDAAKEFWDTDIKGTYLKGETEMSKIYGESSVDTDAVIDEAANFGKVVDDPMAPKFKDVATSKISADPMNPNYKPSVISSKPDVSSGIVDATVSSETARAGQGLLSKSLSRTGEYLAETPGKLAQGAVMDLINPPEVFEPSPRGGYVSQFASQTYEATEQAMQPIKPIGFGDYVQRFALGGEQQGSFLGADFWSSYMQRSLAA